MTERKFILYFSWSRYLEVSSPLEILENRYPTLFEFRRAIYPHYENFADSEKYNQFLAGFLDYVILSDFETFRQFIQKETNHLPEVVQREKDKGENFYLNNELLEDTETGEAKINTLIVVSLDHFKNEQTVRENEIETVKRFLQRENSCLFVCPHHNIGDEENTRVIEHNHHGDVLVPSEQKIGGFAKSLLKELEINVENYFGLNPAASENGNPAPLLINREADELGVLEGVETFNLHPHLPHLEVLNQNEDVRVLARQLINPKAAPHPFVEMGNDAFNSLLWVKPGGDRKGNIFVCDATLWSSAFGGIESLKTFWKNIANL